MSTRFQLLEDAVRNAPTLMLSSPQGGTYPYKVYPFSERGGKKPSGLAREIVERMCESVKQNFMGFNIVASPSYAGLPYAFAIAGAFGKEVQSLTLRMPGASDLVLPGETLVEVVTGYKMDWLLFRNFNQGDSVLIVDDVIDTGATLDAVLLTFKRLGVAVAGVQLIAAMSDKYLQLEKKYGVAIKPLVLDCR